MTDSRKAGDGEGHGRSSRAPSIRRGGPLDRYSEVRCACADSLLIRVPGKAAEYADTAEAAGYNLRRVDADHLGISCDETTTPEHIVAVAAVFGGAAAETAGERIPADLHRTSAFMTHPVFSLHRSETAMLRYLRRLSDRDLALDRTMIPLGSCTMKLNATVEMESISWPEFASIHPFAPDSQTEGWRELLSGLEMTQVDIAVASDDYDASTLQTVDGCPPANRRVRVEVIEQCLLVDDQLQTVRADHQPTGRFTGG